MQTPELPESPDRSAAPVCHAETAYPVGPADGQSPPSPLRRWARRFWKRWRGTLVVILIALTIRSAVADWNDVPTGSMCPAIIEGDRIFVNKLAYDLKVPFTRLRLARWGAPGRGDVVVFFGPEDGVRYVKRVVAVGGDTVAMRDGRLYINGQPGEYHLLSEIPDPRSRLHALPVEESVAGETRTVWMTPGSQSIRTFGPIDVPEGQLFVMGDNRDNSRDSRYFGLVPADCVVGRATMVLMSLDHEHHLRPRWDRFFEEMP
jgi:signal peptidase I